MDESGSSPIPNDAEFVDSEEGQIIAGESHHHAQEEEFVEQVREASNGDEAHDYEAGDEEEPSSSLSSEDDDDDEDIDLPPSLLNRISQMLAEKGIMFPNLGAMAAGAASGVSGLLDDEMKNVERRLREPTIEGIVEYIKSGQCKNVVALVGAGMSTSAGIPFRSPGSGLYDNLQQYNLPSPESMFDIRYFAENPKPFFHLEKKLAPVDLRPTPSHYFLKLLHGKGLLKRVFTQNIDNLERLAGLPDEVIVEAHGWFHTARCLNCGYAYDYEWVKQNVLYPLREERLDVDGDAPSGRAGNADDEEVFVPKCEICNDAIVKPDIVFLGERLPERFFQHATVDLPSCDLVIVIGTLLTVQPFASLVDTVPIHVPRLAINLTKFRERSRIEILLGLVSPASGWRFDHPDNYRDVFMQGKCDDKIRELVELLGWRDEHDAMLVGHPYLFQLKEQEGQKGQEVTPLITTSSESDPSSQPSTSTSVSNYVNSQ